jgi:hypothetical protein
VFADTEAEVTSLGEVALAEFVFLDLEPALENFLGLLPYWLVPLICLHFIFSAAERTLGPRTVTWTEIFSLRRIPNVRTVYRALPGDAQC